MYTLSRIILNYLQYQHKIKINFKNEQLLSFIFLEFNDFFNMVTISNNIKVSFKMIMAFHSSPKFLSQLLLGIEYYGYV